MRNLIKNWATPSMITKIRILITAGTVTPQRLCIPAAGIWRWRSPVTVTTHMSPNSSKLPEYRDSRAWRKRYSSVYAKGVITENIGFHMKELYDIDISNSTISRITDKILPVVKEWQERPIEEVYAVVFMDAIHYHVRSKGCIVKRVVYIALGIDMDGRKDLLGMYVGENESARFWLSIVNGLKNRRVEDILIACVDGLIGFPQAIEAVYPQTEIQQCIIYQIRNSTKFVSYKDIKKTDG